MLPGDVTVSLFPQGKACSLHSSPSPFVGLGNEGTQSGTLKYPFICKFCIPLLFSYSMDMGFLLRTSALAPRVRTPLHAKAG